MIYLDNAATTYPKPKGVYDFADKFYRENGVYQSRGNYSVSRKVNNLIDETRNLLCSLFNAPSNYEVIFTPSSTISINTFINGYSFKNGMNVYITEFEHNAVIRCLHQVSTKYNINIQKIFVNSNKLGYNLNNITTQFEANPPNMIIANHANNVCGLVTPVHEIFKLSKKYNSINVLDASQTSGMLNIDLRNINADCVIFSGHKSLYAPFGIAGMLLNKDINLNPLIYGGTGLDSANVCMPEFYPEKLEAGSMDIYALAGLNKSLKWIREVGAENIYLKEKGLLDYTLSNIDKLSQVKCYIPEGKQIAILSFNVYGYSASEIGCILDKNDIAVRSGLHCCPDAHKIMKTFPGGTVRVGIGYFNCKSDIDKLVSIIGSL